MKPYIHKYLKKYWLAEVTYSRKETLMTVKHKVTGDIHKGNEGERTGCGFNTKDVPSQWINTSEKITCRKKGCKG